MRRYGTWVLFALTLAAVSIHPTPWCIGCETATPFGHPSSRVDDVFQLWLLVAPFLAGCLRLDRAWLTPVFMVAVQLTAQLVGGEPWVDFQGSEGPFIVLFGLPIFLLSFLVGYGCRHCYDILPKHQ